MPLTRARFLTVSSAALGSALGLAACQQPSATPGAPATTAPGAALDWASPPDVARARAQAAEFQTFGMPDSWANFGESLKAFCDKNSFTCSRTDTDMSSNEEITRFDAEKNNPIAVMADIGLLYGPVAEVKAVVPPYLPPNASKLPDNLKARNGGWVATFSGVPAIVVNTDVVKNVPRTWEDLLRPEYKGQIGISDPRTSGPARRSSSPGRSRSVATRPTCSQASTSLENWCRTSRAWRSGNAQTLEKGEIPIQCKYDFNCKAAEEAVKDKGVNAVTIIPGASMYAPSGLMLNKYNTGKMDLAKMYKDVKQVKDWAKADPSRIAELWDSEVLTAGSASARPQRRAGCGPRRSTRGGTRHGACAACGRRPCRSSSSPVRSCLRLPSV